MELTHLAIALFPLALYLMWIGLRGLSRRPLLMRGSTNLALVATAVLGLLLCGPLPLFLPANTITRFGPYVWVLVLALYVLVTILAMLLAPPSLIVTNISSEVLRPLVAEIVGKMDPLCSWAGECVNLPQVGMQLRCEGQPIFQAVVLQSQGSRQNLQGWDHLRRELHSALGKIAVTPNSWSPLWLLGGLSLGAWPVWLFWSDQQMLVRAFGELLTK
ncbi:MAG: hypothetical protein SFX18_09125 [Pirellulales bacterium]|nr:hypothetical protein [Pirellulales bacterium]